MTVTRFVLAVHCHQPVGNFGWVLQEAYTSAYLPFLEALERHPKVPVVFHYTGILLDWFQQEHPEFLRRLSQMVRRGQAEVMGGGYYEPILTMIPQRDAVGQLRQMQQSLHRLRLDGGDHTAAGAWLAERVWEPHLPSLLAQAGTRYTVVDDAHLSQAGVAEESRFGYYLTEDRGDSVALFPSSKQMRYLVPFKPVEEVIQALHQLRSDRPRVVVLADDGEKFGHWPGTHNWVYKEGWLESFLQQLERNEDWLRMMTFGECLETLAPMGRLYLPSGSYEEMLAWSGGFFRNFLVKYPEADTMHKKMLWVSARLERMEHQFRGTSNARRFSEARRHLYMAQSNDAYWHGVFGGLYLQHLRRAVYGHLLQAERQLDELEEKRAWVRAESLDLNADQQQEILLRSKWLTLVVDAPRGGQLLELSDKATGLNLLDTLTRRPEAYHEKLRSPQPVGASEGSSPPQGLAGPLSIHERESSAADLADSLVYDPYRRAGLIDHLLAPDAELQSFARGAAQELGDFVEGPYQGQAARSSASARAVLSRKGGLTLNGVFHPIHLTKKIEIFKKERVVTVTYRIANPASETTSFLFGSEINLGLKDAHVNRVGEADGIRRFAVVDPSVRLQVSWDFNRAARLWYFPLETVSDSDRGLERTYQGVSLTFLWPLALSSHGSWGVTWTFRVESPDGR